MKLKSLIILFAGLIGSAFGQAITPPPTFINGQLNIAFNTRTQLDGDKPREGVTDKYKLKVNVSNSIVFDGGIEYLPNIKGIVGLSQAGALTHSIECLVVNPKNPAQTKNIGRLFGTVPVDVNNVYRFEDGNLRIGIFGSGGAQGFESKVKGLALGKPPQTSDGLWSKLKKEAIKVTKTVNGKDVAIAVTQYDQMTFANHVLAAGPVMIYPEATVNGPMIYDYDRTAWYFNGVTVSYAAPDDNGRILVNNDRLSGNIRWIESPNRVTSGEGEYQFDIRVNEPASSEASAFSGPANEEDFFATDTKVKGLTGTMKYKDTIINGVVTSSIVVIDLKGNGGLSKQQAVYLAKLLLMSCVVPLNAE